MVKIQLDDDPSKLEQPHGLRRLSKSSAPRRATTTRMRLSSSTPPRTKRAMLAAIGVALDRRIVRASAGRAAACAAIGPCPPALSEMELTAHMAALANRNVAAGQKVCFLGGGSYDHFIPAVVDYVGAARRVLHLVHALSARGQPGQPASLLRISNADHAADRHGRVERQSVRRRQRRRPKPC